MRRRGFSLVEILIAAFIMASLLVGLFKLTSSAQRTSMNAYFNFLGSQVAREPIEILRGFGYHWAAGYLKHIPAEPYNFHLGEWVNMSTLFDLHPEMFPRPVKYFRRKVEIDIIKEDFPRALMVTVTVQPLDSSPLKIWLTRDEIVQKGMIVEAPYEFNGN